MVNASGFRISSASLSTDEDAPCSSSWLRIRSRQNATSRSRRRSCVRHNSASVIRSTSAQVVSLAGSSRHDGARCVKNSPSWAFFSPVVNLKLGIIVREKGVFFNTQKRLVPFIQRAAGRFDLQHFHRLHPTDTQQNLLSKTLATTPAIQSVS